MHNIIHHLLSGTIPTSLCKMNLTSLDLSRNHFTGEVPGCLMGINGILNLARNNLQATIPSSNNSVCNLQALNLENNNISGTLPTSLKLCNDIVILDLGNNNLSGNLSIWDSGPMLTSLKVLILRSNMFSGKIPLLLSNLSSLQLLDLSQNHLSGRIPKSFADFKAMSQKHMIDEEMTHSNFEIGDSSGMAEQGDIYTDDISITFKGSVITYTKLLPLFTSIDLSMNELDGEVPRELGKLTFLVNLNLSRNRLTAKIPDTMSALKDLQALDLSQNNLSGQIPKTMRRMTSLSDLNLSFNNLSGSIPSGFQFQTFVDPLVYANNPYLCGFPLEKSCDHEQTPRLVSDKKPIDSNIIGIYISLILGFILGLWSFYGTLCLKKTWRYSYFKFLNEIDEIIYSWYIHN